MNNYYYTFMQKQGVLKDKYVQIEAENMQDSRELMTANFGCQWAFEYLESEFLRNKVKYDLKPYARICLNGEIEYA